MIIHDEAHCRFLQEDHCRFLQEDPKGTAYMEYTCAGNILTVTHTKVPDALAGRGIAGKLASAFYEWAIRHHYIVHSECSYMSHWMEKNK